MTEQMIFSTTAMKLITDNPKTKYSCVAWKLLDIKFTQQETEGSTDIGNEAVHVVADDFFHFRHHVVGVIHGEKTVGLGALFRGFPAYYGGGIDGHVTRFWAVAVGDQWSPITEKRIFICFSQANNIETYCSKKYEVKFVTCSTVEHWGSQSSGSNHNQGNVQLVRLAIW